MDDCAECLHRGAVCFDCQLRAARAEGYAAAVADVVALLEREGYKAARFKIAAGEHIGAAAKGAKT